MNDTVLPPSRAVLTIEDGRVVGLDGDAEQALGIPRSEVLGRPIAEVGKARGRGRFARSGEDLVDRREADVQSPLPALLDSVEQMALMGSWEMDLETDQVRWSDNLYRIFGLEPGEVTPTVDYVIGRVHPDDREQVKSKIEAVRREGRLPPVDYRITDRRGEIRHLHATQAVIEQAANRSRLVVGSVQDVTDRHRAERTIAAHLAVARSLADWQTLEQGATGLLRSVAEGWDCVVGTLWLPAGDVLVAHVTWRSDEEDVTELESLIRQLRLPRGVGAAGLVWETRKPMMVSSLADDPRFRAEAVDGVGGAIALPAVYTQEVLAVLEFFLCDLPTTDASDRLLRSLGGIGFELGNFLAHRRGELKPSPLTPREIEVLQLAAEGYSGREIAERLVVSPATVKRHFEHIYDKYGVSDRASAVAQAFRDGLIQ